MLEVSALEVRYKQVIAVRELTFGVDFGQIVSIVGSNGAGKSSLLRAIAGLVSPASGRITFEGRALDHMAPEAIVRAGIALVPEGRHIFQTLTVAENLALGATPHRGRLPRSEIERVITLFPVLERFYRAPAGGLSGGEQQQLAIARPRSQGGEPGLRRDHATARVGHDRSASGTERDAGRRTRRLLARAQIGQAGRFRHARSAGLARGHGRGILRSAWDLTMTTILQHVIDMITLGSLYALLSLGVALIFGIMRLINLAHGELIMAGGYAIVLLGHPAWPFVVAGSIAVSVILALIVERTAFRPVRKAGEATLLVTSFAVSYLLQNLAILIFGATPRSTDVMPSLDKSFVVGGVTVPRLSVVTVVATGLLLLVLTFFLLRTRFGIQMRAAAEDFDTARLMGVRANQVIAVAFGISGLLAGTAAVLDVSQTGTVFPSMGLPLVLAAFIGTVLGGMRSLPGAVIGAFVLAAISVALASYLPASLRDYGDAFTYLTVILILLYRPDGIIVPRRVRERV
jgi:branched-chain amino acid transport system permease protein